MAAFRHALMVVVAAVVLTGCTDSQVAGSFRSWCKSAPNCDDHSRRQP